MSTGVATLYYGFIRRARSNRRKLALLQLVGRLEDFRAKEFIYHVFRASKGKRFAVTNLAKKGQQRFDILILAGHLEKPRIVGLIEAKYLRNRHRASKFNAADEASAALKSLALQLRDL